MEPPTTMAQFDAAAGWWRAAIYVTACWAVSITTGSFNDIVTEAPVTSDQLSDPAWWGWTIASIAVIAVGYGILWRRWTLHFGRPRALGWQVLFGVMWGTGTGQLFVVIVDLWDRTGWATWGVWLGAYLTISAWQGVFQDFYWDLYVTPEHDTPASITRKVLGSHIPNVTVTLTYLVLYGNRLIFIGLQSAALVAASVCMRMPAPNDRSPTPAASRRPGPFGLSRGAGYATDDPDPFATQRAAVS